MASAQPKRIRKWVCRLLLAPLAMAGLVPAAHAALVISTAATNNVTCSAGTCSATAPDAVLNVNKLAQLLHGSDTQVASGTADTIVIATPLAWTRPSRLTLSARTGITVAQPVAVQGDGAVTLTTTIDPSPAAIAFVRGGKLDFWSTSSSLVVNGNAYTLVSDVPSLVGAIAANTHGHFALARDYDASADAVHRTSPILVLYGTLNGLGHSISNLRIRSAESCAGFIAYLVPDSPSIVANLTLSQIDVTQTPRGNGNPPYGLGGLAGCSQGAVSHVRVTGRVNGGYGAVAGGIVGWQANGGEEVPSILDSSADVSVSGGTGAALGGVVALDFFGIVQRCAASGKIEGSNAAMAGGLAGYLSDSLPTVFIAGNWSSARVSGADYAGGLVGWDNQYASFTDNYATGAVSGSKAAGGLIGNHEGTIAHSYSRGAVSGGQGALLGGAIGTDSQQGTTAIYWDLGKSGVTDPAQGAGNVRNDPGITGLTNKQLKSGLPAGFDPVVWAQDPAINSGYPYLLANPPQ